MIFFSNASLVYILLLLCCVGISQQQGAAGRPAHCFANDDEIDCIGGFYQFSNVIGWGGSIIKLRHCIIFDLTCDNIPNTVTYLDLSGSIGGECKFVCLLDVIISLLIL